MHFRARAKFAALPLFCLLLASCASPIPKPGPPATAASVDVARYAGRWHEVARFPMTFQRADETATADYALLADGRISVHNIATRPDGRTREIRGRATVLNPGENTRLAVRFTNWFGIFIPVRRDGNYWILHVNEGYRHALVGTPDRKCLWMLSRTPTIRPADYLALREKAWQLGFDVTRLIRTTRQGG